MAGHYECRRTVDRAINDKMRVLKDFCVVNHTNEEEIRKMLVLAVRDDLNTHYDIVLDRVAKRLISEKIGGD